MARPLDARVRPYDVRSTASETGYLLVPCPSSAQHLRLSSSNLKPIGCPEPARVGLLVFPAFPPFFNDGCDGGLCNTCMRPQPVRTSDFISVVGNADHAYHPWLSRHVRNEANFMTCSVLNVNAFRFLVSKESFSCYDFLRIRDGVLLVPTFVQCTHERLRRTKAFHVHLQDR